MVISRFHLLFVPNFLKTSFPFCLAEMVQSLRAFGWFEQRLASLRYRAHKSGKGCVEKNITQIVVSIWHHFVQNR